MKYNRALDLIAMSLGAARAGMPVKAAKFMQEASTHADAEDAIKLISLSNTKKSETAEVFGEQDDLMEDADDLKLESAVDDVEEDDTEEAAVLAAVASAMAKVKAKAQAKAASKSPDRDEDQQPGNDDREEPKVNKASVTDKKVISASDATKRFARTLANLSR